MPTFDDVPETYEFYHEIEACYAAGLIIGTQLSPPLYDPTSSCTVAQYLTILARAAHYRYPEEIEEQETSMPALYSDVGQTHWAFGYVQRAAKIGITGGETLADFTPGTVGEATAVKRKWSVTWACRARKETRLIVTTARFTDVPITYYLSGWIERAAALGITRGTSPTTFEPETVMTRGQMAAFIQRAFDVPFVTGPPNAPNIEQ